MIYHYHPFYCGIFHEINHPGDGAQVDALERWARQMKTDGVDDVDVTFITR